MELGNFRETKLQRAAVLPADFAKLTTSMMQGGDGFCLYHSHEEFVRNQIWEIWLSPAGAAPASPQLSVWCSPAQCLGFPALCLGLPSSVFGAPQLSVWGSPALGPWEGTARPHGRQCTHLEAQALSAVQTKISGEARSLCCTAAVPLSTAHDWECPYRVCFNLCVSLCHCMLYKCSCQLCSQCHACVKTLRFYIVVKICLDVQIHSSGFPIITQG